MFWATAAISGIILVLGAAAGFSAAGPWDDAYMFARYADNVARHGALAWNPGDEPTYGLTSLAFVALVFPLRLAGGSPALALVLASVFGGVIFFLLLVRLLRRGVAPGSAVGAVLGAIVLASVGLSGHRLALHLVNGMDTTLALAYVAGYVLLIARYERAPTRAGALGLGLYGAPALWIRPDLLVYALGVPLALVAFPPSPAGRRISGEPESEARSRARRDGVVVIAIVAGATAIQLGIARWYFGSALPLSFYAKSSGLYGERFYEHYRLESLLQLGQFLESYWVLAVLLGLSLAIGPRRWWRESSAGEKGLLAATGVFVAYYAIHVVQIMGMHQRFYYPVLPALAFVAARAAAHTVAHARVAVAWTPPLPALPALGLAAALLVLTPTAAVVTVQAVRALEERRLGSFDMTAHYRRHWGGWWFRLDAFSALPDDLVIATTEVGLPAALNPRKRILDLAGLNDRAIAFDGFDPAVFFRRHRPDVLYLPHPHYREMIHAIVTDPTFVTEYDYHPAEALWVGMGVAVWRGSKHYARLAELVRR